MVNLPKRVARTCLLLLLPALLGANPLDPPPGDNPEVVIPLGPGEAPPLPPSPSPRAPAPIPSPSPSPTPAAGPPSPPPTAPGGIRFHALENGLSVLVESRPEIPAVAVQLWLEVSPALEGPAERGSVTILHHLLQERLERHLLASPPGLRAAANRVRVEEGRDTLSLGLEGPSELLEGLLRALARAVQDLDLHGEEIEAARARAGQATRQLESDGDLLAASALTSLAFRVHPYRHHPLSSAGALLRCTARDVRAFGLRELGPHRAHLVVVGQLDESAAARTILQEFGSWRTPPPPPRHRLVEPKLLESRLGTVASPDGVRRLHLGFPAPAYRGEHSPGFSVLAQLLDPSSHTAVSRLLLQALPEGSELSCHYVPARDPSLLSLRVRGGEFEDEDLTRRLFEVLEQLGESGISEGDLELAKSRLRNLALARTQGYREQARALGLTRILSAPEAPRPILERVMALTPSDLQELAREALDRKAFVGVSLVPRPVADPPVAQAPRPPELHEVAGGALLLQAHSGPRDVTTGSLRIRLGRLPLRPGEVAALRRHLLRALQSSTSPSSWVVDAPLPGLDRDGLSFQVTSPPEEFPRALTFLLRNLIEGIDGPSDSVRPLQEASSVRDETLARGMDHSLSLLLPEGPLGTPHFSEEGPAPSRERLRELAHRALAPENLLLAISAGADPSQARQALEVTLGSRPETLAPLPETPPSRDAPGTPPSPPSPEGQVVVVFSATLPQLQERNLQGAATLARVLGNGPGSRLGRRLRNSHPLGFEVGARFLPFEGGPGVLVAWIGCSPDQAELAELVLREEVGRLTLEPIGTEELLATRESRRQDWLIDLQSTRRLTARLAREAQREVRGASSRALLDPVFLQELARATFDDARIETFPGRLLASRRPGDP